MTSPASLPYHEPTIITIIIQASLLLLLNILNHVLDKVVYCGLLGQVLLGVAWGTPGAKWLGVDAETVIVNLGYLGLLLLVYEGWSSDFYPITLLTLNRWFVHVSQLSQGQSASILCRSRNRHWPPSWLILCPGQPHQCHPSPMLCRGCCPVLDESGHDFHRAWNERANDVPPWSCAQQCGDDGRCRGPGHGSNHF